MMQLTTEIRSPIGYYGSKWMMRKVIVGAFPEHDTYVDVFGGSGIVMFSKPPELSKKEVYNDYDRGLACLYNVLRNRPDEFLDLMDITLYRREDYEESVKALKAGTDTDELEIARRMFLVANATICGGGQQLSPGRFRTNRRGPSSAVGFKNKISRVDDVYDRLRDVIIENMDWRRMIDRYDAPDTLFYIDPPYANVAKKYRYSMADQDHLDLCKRLESIEGLFVLSGVEGVYSKLLDPWCSKHTHFQRNASKSNVPGKNRPKEYTLAKEILWSNFAYESDEAPG